MPWVDVREPHAVVPVVDQSTASTPLDGMVQPVSGEHRFDDIVLDGDLVELGDYARLVLEYSSVQNLVLCPEDSIELDASWCTFSYCDLSRGQVHRLRGSVLSDCKFMGTDFSDADVMDVVFERCVFSLASLRMARLRRVRFEDCTLSDVDAFELTATDVSFDGSELDKVNVDRLRATRVDLHGAQSLRLENVVRLEGVLVAEHQLPGLTVGTT